MKDSDKYILFIDESGHSALSDRGRFFLLSGLIINKDLHTALSSYMVSLKEKSKIPTDENIHAFDLFEGERRKMVDRKGRVMKDNSGVAKHKRIAYSNINIFFERLSFLVEGADMKCFILRQDKIFYSRLVEKTARQRKVKGKRINDYLKRKQLNDFLYEALVRKMVLEFGHFLEEKDGSGEIMAESRRQGDEAVLRAFISATHESNFVEDSRYRAWARSSLKRIHSLIFQNKKGLSFGLEIADLFGWAHLNKKYGRSFPIQSKTKVRRVEFRINRIDKMMR